MMALSRKTMNEFREYFVGTSLAVVRDAFEAHGLHAAAVPENPNITGERRRLVERYYAKIDLSHPHQVERLLAVYADVIFDLPEGEYRQRLIDLLKRDGIDYTEGRLRPRNAKLAIVAAIPKTGLDTGNLQKYVERIANSVESDPELAIGSAKELVEGTLKSILAGLREPFDDKADDVPALLKKVQKCLGLAPDEVDTAKKGAETIKRTLSNLGSVVVGIAELRNLYGSGHGKATARRIDIRIARLAVGSAATLSRFLLETYEARTSGKGASSERKP